MITVSIDEAKALLSSYADAGPRHRAIFPVWKNEDGEFILYSELGYDRDSAIDAARNTDEQTGPSWARANPVTRYARTLVLVVELEQGYGL